MSEESRVGMALWASVYIETLKLNALPSLMHGASDFARMKADEALAVFRKTFPGGGDGT